MKKVLLTLLLFVIFSPSFSHTVHAGQPAFPSCPAGSTQLTQFGPTDVYSLVGREAWPDTATFNNSGGSTGSVIVWQGEGHFWDFGCNEGPNNDPATSTGCDDMQPNETATFLMNGTKVGEFIDHNPDDDRNFLYTFPVNNFVSGSNTLSYKGPVNTTSQETQVYVKGVVCSTPPPTPTPTRTPTPTPKPATPTPTISIPDTPSVSVPACITNDYTGSGITVTWTNKFVTSLQISGDKDFAFYPSSKSVTTGTTSTTAPAGFQFFGDPLKLKAGAPYFVRTNNGINSTYATFTIPLCTPTATPAPLCPTKSSGDANCDGQISLADFEFWRREFTSGVATKNADFSNNVTIDLADFEIWRAHAFAL